MNTLKKIIGKGSSPSKANTKNMTKEEGIHFILGTPYDFDTAQKTSGKPLSRAVFATGCFWGAEKIFWRLPRGVYSTSVGYTNGSTDNPSYHQVCSGSSGHAEAVQVLFDPSQISYADLLRAFWESHDPTQGNGQGGDRGSQYRSGIYFCDESQKELALASRKYYESELMALGKGQNGGKITTEVTPLKRYWQAEEYHQQYLAIPGNRQYCSAMPTCVKLKGACWIPEGLREGYGVRLSEKFWDKHGTKPGCAIKSANEPIVWNE